MEINTISSFNHDQRARVKDNATVGAVLGAAAGAVSAKSALQKAFKSQGYTDTFVNNVKDFATAKTIKTDAADKIKETLTKKDFLKKIAVNKIIRGGAIGAALVAGAGLGAFLLGKIAKNSTELKISKEMLD